MRTVAPPPKQKRPEAILLYDKSYNAATTLARGFYSIAIVLVASHDLTRAADVHHNLPLENPKRVASSREAMISVAVIR